MKKNTKSGYCQVDSPHFSRRARTVTGPMAKANGVAAETVDKVYPAGWTDGRKGQKEDECDRSGHDKNGDRVRGGRGRHCREKRRFPREGTRGCGEVTELELSDRNDAKALATVRG